MAIAYVTSVSDFADSGSTSQAAPSVTVAAGDLLIVPFTWGSTNGATVGAISDNLGNTWSEISTQSGDTNDQWFKAFYSVITNAGSCTVTVTYGSAIAGDFRRIIVSQYTGAHASPLDDVEKIEDGSATTATDNAATASLTPTQGGELIWCAIEIPQADQNFTAGTNFTKRHQEASTTGGPMAVEDWIQTSATNTAGLWTLATATTGHLMMYAATFKAADGGGPVLGKQYSWHFG